ncbi:hypothetical protein AYO38_11100 [bacterium SCGC AG-212-C10]|nr:hypothetical protein AYO38_11100 [bacterium SCGC AG-212-C10]
MSNGDQFEIWVRLLFALGLGAAVGLEREFRGHEAGIRTSALVCLGAAAFGEVSEHFGDSRVAAGVVQGVGFLGAGLIFQGHRNVKGVTTAATMWLMAGLGLIVSEGLWLTALLLTGTIIVLLELSPVSDWVYRLGKREGSRLHRLKEDDEKHGWD